MRGSNILQSPRRAVWQVHNVNLSAAEMHSRDLPAQRGIWNVAIANTALVLGSSQKINVVDQEACKRANVEVAKRRTGGGAVYLALGEHLWVDVVVPRDDPLWSDDVVISPQWIGDAWSRALTSLGMPQISVHRTSIETSTWSDLICFAGVGQGEVLIGGKKVVGISQRRTNKSARFQCFIHRSWAPEKFVHLFAPPRPSVEELSEMVAVIDGDLTHLLDAFVGALSEL
ncbi:MAG: hypothetical protein WC864_00315 [Ilumatobacteraceae bacterium]